MIFIFSIKISKLITSQVADHTLDGAVLITFFDGEMSSE